MLLQINTDTTKTNTMWALRLSMEKNRVNPIVIMPPKITVNQSGGGNFPCLPYKRVYRYSRKTDSECTTSAYAVCCWMVTGANVCTDFTTS